MKTLRLTVCALLAAGALQAQFFQDVYGLNTQDVLQTGVNVTVGAPMGYLMAGYTDQPVAGGPNSVMVVRTDINGNIGALNTFNNGYQLVDAAGVVVNAQARKMVQHPGGRILIWGDYGYTPGGPSTNFFYMVVAPNGGPGFVASYNPPIGVADVRATSISVSTSNPNNVFVSGYVTDFSGIDYPVVMSLQVGGGIINWGWMYAQGSGAMQCRPMDLVESPYTATPDVAVVGYHNMTTTPNGDGMFFTVDANTGASTSPLNLYGQTATDDGLNAITVARNPTGLGRGFAMAGFTYDNVTVPNAYQSWAMKINPVGAVDWSTELLYAPVTTDNYAYDIIERFNTNGRFEYYVGGYVTNGFLGGEDALVHKLDFAGNPTPGNPNQWEYGNVSNERAYELDQYNAGSNGLSVFGVSDNPSGVGMNDFYLVRAYFNGVTACDTNRIFTTYLPGPLSLPPQPFAIRSPFSQSPMSFAMVFRMKMISLCYATGIAGGSNARLAPATTEPTELALFPNPVQHDNAQLTLTLDQPAEGGEVQVELWNMLGQRCATQLVTLARGQQQVAIDLGNALKPGVYHLVLKQNNVQQDFQVSVQ